MAWLIEVYDPLIIAGRQDRENIYLLELDAGVEEIPSSVDVRPCLSTESRLEGWSVRLILTCLIGCVSWLE